MSNPMLKLEELKAEVHELMCMAQLTTEKFDRSFDIDAMAGHAITKRGHFEQMDFAVQNLRLRAEMLDDAIGRLLLDMEARL